MLQNFYFFLPPGLQSLIIHLAYHKRKGYNVIRRPHMSVGHRSEGGEVKFSGIAQGQD